MELTEFLNQNAWVAVIIAVLLGLHTIVKAVRDAIDKTPATDDNAFERFASILAKIAQYLIGIRAK